jgi:hypothetical protein
MCVQRPAAQLGAGADFGPGSATLFCASCSAPKPLSWKRWADQNVANNQQQAWTLEIDPGGPSIRHKMLLRFRVRKSCSTAPQFFSSSTIPTITPGPFWRVSRSVPRRARSSRWLPQYAMISRCTRSPIYLLAGLRPERTSAHLGFESATQKCENGDGDGRDNFIPERRSRHLRLEAAR